MANVTIKSAWQRDFKVLAHNQALMIRLGLSSSNLTEPSNEFFKSFVPYFNLTFLSINLILCGWIMFRYFPELDLILEPLLIIIAGVQSGGMFLSIGLNMKNVKALFIAVEKIVHDERENEDVIELYWRIEEKCRRYTKMISGYLVLNQSMYMAAIVVSILSMLNDDYDTSNWILPWSVPFDTQHLSVLQWYLLWFTQFSFGLAYSSSTLTVTSYFVCGCFYIGGFCDHFNFLLESIKDDLHTDSKAKKHLDWTSDKIHCVNVKLCKAIGMHEKIYDIFHIMAVTNNGAIFVLLLPNVIFLALTMYTTEHATMDWVLIAFHTVCTACSLCWPYIYCHFATMTTDRIVSIGDIAYSANWYDYPLVLRKHLILIILRSQEEVVFSGFGFIYCTLEVLLKLMKASCSYYLLFRTLSEDQ